MYVDYHVHSEFSDDSFEPMENQVQKGIELGLSEICFTEHVDYGVKRDWDDPLGIEYRKDSNEPFANCDYPKYFNKIDQMREIYSEKITIKKGLEFGVQSITVNDFNKLFERYQNQLDFVLFSMHQVDNQEFWTGDYFNGKTQKEYNEKYYAEIYKTMQLYKDYSCLAHLDLLSRYDPVGIYPFDNVKDIIAEILKLAIKDNKGIEINTSSWKYGLADTQPSPAILRLYKDLGGKIITIGSDAHKTKYLADHNQEALSILKDEIGFNEICTFEKMTPIFHKI